MFYVIAIKKLIEDSLIQTTEDSRCHITVLYEDASPTTRTMRRAVSFSFLKKMELRENNG